MSGGYPLIYREVGVVDPISQNRWKLDSRTPAFDGSWLQWPWGAPSPNSLMPHKTHEVVLATALAPLGNRDERDGHLQCQGERWRRAECRPAPASSHPINGKRKHGMVDRHSRESHGTIVTKYLDLQKSEDM
jgi:hypothetical protein